MSTSMSKLELIAYADGELPPERAAMVERVLASNPGLRLEVEQLRRLRDAARAVFRYDAPAVSDALRDSIETMAVDIEPNQAAASVIGSRARGSRRVFALAAAIAVAAAGGAGLWLVLHETHSETGAGTLTHVATADSATAPVPATVVSAVQRRHLSCSQMEDHFFDPRFPRQIAEIQSPMREFLGHSGTIPDLRAIELAFAGAGPCAIPGGETLHVLYRGDSSGGARYVSLFIQPFKGQVHFDTTRAVVLAGPDAAHPILAWRTEELVYFLIGDDFGASRDAAALMGKTWEKQ
jgi:anti-sigma factor RsiW